VRTLRFTRFAVLAVALAMLAGFMAPSAASAEQGSPTAIYSCYNAPLNATYDVTNLAACDWGVITIYSTYDTKKHGEIQIRNGQPYIPGMDFGQFVDFVLKGVATNVANKLWTALKNFFKNGDGGGPLPPDPDL
jgi:hypothetical protein